MKFDVIIGNPPYQMNDGGAGASSVPLYHKFIQQAKKLNPRFLTMIIPARWYAGGKGLDEFRDEMLNDKRISHLVDYPKSKECFAGSVKIEGGVCYFLWERDNNQKCKVVNIFEGKRSSELRFLKEEKSNIFIRFNQSINIYKKVINQNEESFSNIVSSRKPFGFASNFSEFKNNFFEKSVKFYGNKVIGYVDKNNINNGLEYLNCYKIFISYPTQVINKPIIPENLSCCSETYIVIGPFKNEIEQKNCFEYIKTKFFRFMVLLMKNTQHGTKEVYKFVPQQDFSQSWNDDKLYKKYNLLPEEIEFINSMIKPMELNHD